MDSFFGGVSFNLSKSSKMSVDEKRQLVYELSKQSHVASELLQTWSRQEILQILCAEMGKERKYTGLTKMKIIEALLKIISDKKPEDNDKKRDSSPVYRNLKRRRKTDNPSRLVIPTSNASGSSNSISIPVDNTIYCKNLACRAILRQEDTFCRRCSCCICHRYDDNKDPSLWLICSSELPFPGDSCGLSCHLECAFKHEKSGIGKDKRTAFVDGCFYCVSCGKTNDLLECWKKQLTIAKDTRRVDVLCYRLFLARKLLKNTKKHQNLFEIVDAAAENLEAEVGPLTGHPLKMARGIVNRLLSGPEVQKLCSSALESLEKTLSLAAFHSSQVSKMQDAATTGPTKVRFEDVHATSLTVILCINESSSPANIVHYSLWHKKVTDKDYPEKSTCTLFTPNTRFVISGLTPATEYSFQVVSFSGTRETGTDEINISTRSTGEEEEEEEEDDDDDDDDEAVNCSSIVERSESPTTNCSSLSVPSSVEAESNNNYVSYCKQTQNEEENKHVIRQNSSIHHDSPSNEDQNAKRVSAERHFDAVQIERNSSFEAQIVSEEVVAVPDIRSETPMVVQKQNISEEANLPITPFRSDQIKNRQTRTGKSKEENTPEKIEIAGVTKKKGGIRGKPEGEFSDNGFEQCVKMVRELECSGHVEKDFRQKFLTWFSLRATSQEIRVVKTFIETFMDDAEALAEQLVDTFSDRISCKSYATAVAAASASASAVVPAGFCMKLWH